MLEIRFRPSEAWPEAGDEACLLLRARDPSGSGQIAQTVAEQGAGGLLELGRGDPEAIYAPAVPVLDDVLALWLLLREEQPPAKAVAPLVTYARLRRAGLASDDQPPDRSPDAIFDEIRRGGRDLADPTVARRLLERTFALFEHLAARLQTGERLDSETLFDETADFDEEISLLRRDHDQYLEDRRRSPAFIATFEQDGVRREVDLLVLEVPTCTRFKDWARQDTTSPSGLGFALLLVAWDDRTWVLSADPARRLKVGHLAQLLQEAETDKRGSPPPEPWYAGERHDGTLVAAPRTGTELSRDEILAVLRAPLELRAPTGRRTGSPRGWAPVLAVAALLVLALPIGWWVLTPDGGELSSGLSSETLSLTRAARRAPGSLEPVIPKIAYASRHALVIGISEYEDPAVKRIPIAREDAIGFAELLKSTYGFEDVRLLLDTDEVKPTRDVIMGTLATFDGLESDDAFLIFWAGHGDTAETRTGEQEGFLVPWDGSLDGSQRFRNISMTQLRREIDMYVGAEHKLLIADACHSGLLLRGNGPKAPRLSADYLRDARRETFQVITAGTEKEEVLDGGPGGHSVFTGYLIERLEDNPDGVLTALELFAEVRDVVARRARDRGKQQTPNYNRISGSGDFLFYKQPPATGAEAEPASPDAATERGPAAARPATP